MQIEISNNNKLPFTNDLIKAIIEFAPTYISDKQKCAVVDVLNSIYELWIAIFGTNNIVSKPTVRGKIYKCLKKYDKSIMKRSGSRTDINTFYKRYNFLFKIL
jgi:hypothetical protein